MTFRRGNLLSARFAPDGQTVVYSAAWEGKPAELFSVRTDSMESRPLGIERADVVSVSSQGELAVKLSKGNYQAPETVATLARVPLGGGAPREIAENVVSAAWTPDGRDLAMIRLTPDGDGRLEWPIGHVVYESFLLSWDLAVSPDGGRLAFMEWNPGPGMTIWTLDRQGRKTAAAAGLTAFGHLAWSKRTGDLLFLGARGSGDLALRSVSASGRERLLGRRLPASTCTTSRRMDGFSSSVSTCGEA